MKVLAVETATSWQSVALLNGDRVLSRHDHEAAGSHTKTLLPTIDRLFSETGLSPSVLDGLVVSVGPGSFTGLRVGLATVLGLRTVTQLPIAIVPTLEGMAWNLRGAATPLCPIINSRRGEVYWALFQWMGQERIERLVPEQVGNPAALGKQLKGEVTVFGEGWSTEETAIRAALFPSAKIVQAPDLAGKPSAVSIGLAGIMRLRSGELAGVGISPLYIQRPEAEVKYEESGGLSPVARRQEKITKKLGIRQVQSVGKSRKV